MTTHKHTPAPLIAENCGDGGWNVYDESGMACICTCWSGVLPDPSGQANAILHAAAPTLLSVLEEGHMRHTFAETLREVASGLEYCPTYTDWLRAKADAIDAAVKLATGEKGGGA